MAESGLSIGLPELREAIGFAIGYGRAGWSDAKKAVLDGFIQSGVRRVYYPPAVERTAIGYEWSWLHPTATLTIESGEGDYDLPDDFGRLMGAFHYPADEHRASVSIMSVGRLLAMRAHSSISGAPTYAAIRFKVSDRTTGQRQEVLFFPKPDDDWVMPYEYEAYSGALTDAYPYALGGMQLSELYIESCLAVAEERIDDEKGVHAAAFDRLLIDAIARDRKRGARNFGQMGHTERTTAEFRRGWTGSTYPVSYHGVDL